jgi:hypothetical protein
VVPRHISYQMCCFDISSAVIEVNETIVTKFHFTQLHLPTVFAVIAHVVHCDCVLYTCIQPLQS